MEKDIHQQEEELFKEWKKSRRGFSPDGIVNEKQYFESKPKIMLVLKEVNDKQGKSVDLKEFLKNGAYDRKSTWDNVTRWIYGIRNLEKELIWKDLENGDFLNNERKKLLPSLCVMNVKKSPGGHTANEKKLWEIAEEDKEFLSEQFNIYTNDEESRPDIIIGCGAAASNIFIRYTDIIKDKAQWEQTSRGIEYYEFEKGKYFIYYLHPEARVKDNLLYYGLIDAIKEIVN